MNMNDTERLDFLEKMFAENAQFGYDRVCLRKSVIGRGFRLHHVRNDNWGPSFSTVRQAIDSYAAFPRCVKQ